MEKVTTPVASGPVNLVKVLPVKAVCFNICYDSGSVPSMEEPNAVLSPVSFGGRISQCQLNACFRADWTTQHF